MSLDAAELDRACGKHVAVMQPYLFPYLGYYQLVNRVESFVFLDDVNFIKQGFINRNCIRVNNSAFRFVLPIADISQNRKIMEHYFLVECDALVKTIDQAYRRAPYHSRVMPIVEAVLCQDDRRVSRLAANSICAVCNYIGLEKEFLFSSELPLGSQSKGQARIIEICTTIGATSYANAIGGVARYDREEFARHGVHLEFLSMADPLYSAPKFPYLPRMSIIDALMLCSISEIRALLELYDLQ